MFASQLFVKVPPGLFNVYVDTPVYVLVQLHFVMGQYGQQRNCLTIWSRSVESQKNPYSYLFAVSKLQTDQHLYSLSVSYKQTSTCILQVTCSFTLPKSA
jgi:hypothetical protein